MISIIIPTFNRKQLLSFTIDNLLQRSSYQKDEIIVVDDHSTDGTVDHLVHRFGTEIIIVANKGKGPGAARNTGLKIASGHYIKFFDSDDVLSPNTLEVQKNELAKSSAGFLYSPYIRATQDLEGRWHPIDHVILNFHPYDNRYPLNYWMLRGLFLTIPSMLFKRDVLNEVGPWPELTTAYEDWEYLWRIGLVEPYPVHTNQTVFLYRQHGAQSTQHNADDLQRDKEAVLVFEKVLAEYFDNYSTSRREKLLLTAKIYKILKLHQFDNSFKHNLSWYNKPIIEVVLAYQRIVNKIHRLQTQSDWAPYHGPETSPEQLAKFMTLFN